MAIDVTGRILTFPLLSRRRDAARGELERSISLDVTDEALLGRVQGRDEEALLLLFHRYNVLAFSIGCRILRDEGEAEDLVQEVFLRLHSRDNTFDPLKGSARTWIVQMIYRRAFDRRSYLQRRHFYHGTDGLDDANALTGERSLESDVIERLTAAQLRDAFGELSERQRQTLDWFFFEGLTLVEIAERSGEDLKNVRHHYYRGLERLRQVAHAIIRNEKSDR